MKKKISKLLLSVVMIMSMFSVYIANNATEVQAATFDPVWPVKGNYYITALNYYWNDGSPSQHKDGLYGYDHCIDIGGAADILAIESGTVITVVTGKHNNTPSEGFGNYVEIQHDNGYKTLYGHLASISVSKGEKVTKGQKIGYMGQTGNASGVHLHFSCDCETPWKLFREKYYKELKYGTNVYKANNNKSSVSVCKEVANWISTYYKISNSWYVSNGKSPVPDPDKLDPSYNYPFHYRYTGSKLSTYGSKNGSTDGSYIATNDDCVVNSVYESGWMSVTFPGTNGNITKWTKVTAFFGGSCSPVSAKAPMKTSKLYYDSGGKNVRSGWIDAGDSITKLRTVGNYTLTVFPGSSYKIAAWALTKEIEYDIGKFTVSLNTTSLTYNGKAQSVSATVKNLNGGTLTLNTDYTISGNSNTNAGTYTARVTGKGNYAGWKDLTYKINPATITSVSVSPTSYSYTGKAITPSSITVKAGSLTLGSGDYTATYSNNTNAGTATLTVTGKGNYTGSKSVNYTIENPNVTLISYENTSQKNYLYGSDFASSLNTSYWFSRDTSISTIEIDSTNKHNSYNSLKIVNTAAGSSGKDLCITTQTNANNVVSQDNYAGDNKAMTLSFWAKSSVSGTKMYFRWGYQSEYRDVSLTTEWKKYTVQMNKIPAYGNCIHPYLDRAGTAWISEVQLEDGTSATDFVAENGSQKRTSNTAGGKYTLPAEPSRFGYNFVGWFTALSGGEQITSSTTVKNTNIVVYARWEKEQSAIGLPKDRTIPDGIYSILHGVDHSFGISIKENNTEDGADVHLWNYKPENEFMKFEIKYLGNGLYSVKSVGAGRYFDVQGVSGQAGRDSGANVHLYGTATNQFREFYIVPVENGNYYFIPYCAIDCLLDVVNGEAKAGTNVRIWTQANGDRPQFFLQARGDVSDVTLPETEYVYEGKAVTPEVTVKDFTGAVLVKDQDYTVAYENNNAAGTGKVTVTGKGNYEGSKSVNFTITEKEELSEDVVCIQGESVTGSYREGTMINVPVNVTQNPGFISGAVEVSFDSSVFELADVVYGFAPAYSSAPLESASSGKYLVQFGSDENEKNYTEDGQLFTLVFKVKKDAESKKYSIGLDALDGMWVDENVQEIEAKALRNAEVNLEETYLIGDVNNDGKVNATDRTILVRYLAKWEGYSEKILNWEAADINRDGKVNATDRTILVRYLAKWGEPYSGYFD